MNNLARAHHYAPQFYLRLFSSDIERSKINTVRKNQQMAIWTERSIKETGKEHDLYVAEVDGAPICYEDRIGQNIENPLTQSQTWRKISEHASADIDRSDKAVIYSIIRHFEARNPHYLATFRELAQMAFNNSPQCPLVGDERANYAEAHANPKVFKQIFNKMSSSLNWTTRSFRGAGVTIARSPVRLRSSTTPVLALPSTPHPKLGPLSPGMIPFQLVLTLNPFTIATLVLGDFDDAFLNIEIDMATARGVNRQYAAYFAKFPSVENLITERDDLIEDMTWAPYFVVSNQSNKIKFKRSDGFTA